MKQNIYLNKYVISFLLKQQILGNRNFWYRIVRDEKLHHVSLQYMEKKLIEFSRENTFYTTYKYYK
jgi:hypothetical protein